MAPRGSRHRALCMASQLALLCCVALMRVVRQSVQRRAARSQLRACDWVTNLASGGRRIYHFMADAPLLWGQLQRPTRHSPCLPRAQADGRELAAAPSAAVAPAQLTPAQLAIQQQKAAAAQQAAQQHAQAVAAIAASLQADLVRPPPAAAPSGGGSAALLRAPARRRDTRRVPQAHDGAPPPPPRRARRSRRPRRTCNRSS